MDFYKQSFYIFKRQTDNVSSCSGSCKGPCDRLATKTENKDNRTTFLSNKKRATVLISGSTINLHWVIFLFKFLFLRLMVVMDIVMLQEEVVEALVVESLFIIVEGSLMGSLKLLVGTVT